ncbi:hypothetical protein JCM11641_001845 [Rhodosporidiobolus odoratus]
MSTITILLTLLVGAAAVQASTSNIATVYTPTATVTEVSTTTVLSTRALSTVVEVETTEIDLGPDYYIEDFTYGGVTTPLTSTAHVSTDVTTTPEAVTATATNTPATVTIYQTKWETSTPSVSTYTATQTISSGSSGCVNARLAFPAACCPSDYVKLRAFPVFARRTLALEATQTIGTGVTTVTSVSTQTIEAETPLPVATITQTVTEYAPRPEVGITATYYDEADTPLVSDFTTVYHEASTPTVTVYSTLSAPTTTVTRTGTVTLQPAVTTTTQTVSGKPTACAEKTVYTQALCPLSNLLRTTVQDAQVAALKLWKASSGRSVVVDCGSAGRFLY